MSMKDFQCVLGRMIAIPSFARAVALDAGGESNANGAMASYDLEERERTRAIAAAGGTRMEVLTLLYRGARAAPIMRFCAITCELLGEDRLHDLLVAYWEQGPRSSAYYRDEVRGFASFVAGRDDVEPSIKDAAAIEGALVELERAVMPERYREVRLGDEVADVQPVLHTACRLLWLNENPSASTDVSGGHEKAPRRWPVLVDSRRDGINAVSVLPPSEVALVRECDGRRSLGALCEHHGVRWERSSLAHWAVLMARSNPAA